MQVKWEIQYCFKHSNLVISGMFSKQQQLFGGFSVSSSLERFLEIYLSAKFVFYLFSGMQVCN